MRGGTDDNDLWMKTFGMSGALLSLVYAQRKLHGAIVACVMSRQATGQNSLFFPSKSARLLMGSLNKDE
jgi:hypothetical protein